MKGPAFLLPVYTITDEELIGAAIVLADDEHLSLYRALIHQSAVIQATALTTVPVTVAGPKFDGYRRISDLDPTRMALVVKAAENHGVVLLPDADLLDVSDEVDDLLQSGAVRDLDLQVSSGGFYWTGVLRGESGEEIAIGTGLIDQDDLDRVRGRGSARNPRTDVADLIDAAASVIRWYEDMRPIEGPMPLFDLKAAVGRILGMPRWRRNDLQFPRLLAEIVATQDNLDMDALAESMDLTVEEVNELFDRAQLDWELIKLTA